MKFNGIWSCWGGAKGESASAWGLRRRFIAGAPAYFVSSVRTFDCWGYTRELDCAVGRPPWFRLLGLHCWGGASVWLFCLRFLPGSGRGPLAGFIAGGVLSGFIFSSLVTLVVVGDVDSGQRTTRGSATVWGLVGAG